MSLGPLNRPDAQPKPSAWRRWLRRCRRARIVLALLILIGITTPHATSAPADEAQVDPVGSSVASTPALDDPPTIMLIGAAMLMLAGALRRSESSKLRG